MMDDNDDVYNTDYGDDNYDDDDDDDDGGLEAIK